MSAPTPELRYATDPEHVFEALTKNTHGRILTILLDVPGGSHEPTIDYISNSDLALLYQFHPLFCILVLRIGHQPM